MKFLTRVCLLSAFFLLWGGLQVLLAQPANDQCAGAEVIGALPYTSTAYDVTLATTTGDPGIPTCQSNVSRSIWFSFTPATTGTYYLSTCQSDAPSSTLPDVILAVYTSAGPCTAPYTSVACNDDGCTTLGLQSVLYATLTGGTTYYLVAWSFNTTVPTAGAASIQLYVNAPTTPANDECATATPLSVNATLTCSASLTGSTALATTSAGIPIGTCTGTPDDDVWYSFTAGGTSQIVTLTNQAPDNAAAPTVIQVLSGTCGALTSVACASGSTLTASGLTIGNSYFVRVYTSGASPIASTYTICLTTPPAPPANDNCAGAFTATVSTFGACSYNAVVTSSATQSTPNPAAGCTTTGNNDDVWYTFTTVGAGAYTFSYTSLIATVGTATTVGMDVYTGTCAGLTTVTGACTSGFTGSRTVTLAAATTYYLRLFAGGTANSATFNFCIEQPAPPPANDECVGATPITNGLAQFVNPGPQSTAGATQSLAPINCNASGLSTTALDIWFKFTTDADGGDISFDVVPTTATDIIVQGFTTAGMCSGASVCADVNVAAGPLTNGGETLMMTGLAPASTYFFRIYRFSNTGVYSVNVTAASGTALPLELKSFTGRVQGSVNVLNWETLTEQNVQSHIVERSIDGTRWMEVGSVAAKGNSQVSVKYSLEDRAPLAKAYYRLRSVDFDGKENLSSSIVLTRKGDHFAITSVYPSPTSSNVTVQFNATTEEKVTIRVMDMTGRLVMEQYAEAVKDINELPIALNGLQAGVYTVTVSNSTGVSAPVRFVKQ